MEKTRCECSLADCAYYHKVPGSSNLCDCSHADKPHYMRNPCPLYRKDWMNAEADRAKELRERFLKKRV